MSKLDPYAAPSRIYAKTAESVPEPVEDGLVVPTGFIAEVKEWVGEDKERAALALEAEHASDHPRVTLIEYLEDLVTG